MVNESADTKPTFLLELYRKALSLQKNELYEYFLNHAVKVTQSKIGFFHFVSSDEKTIVLTTWNKQALKTCKADYTSHYPIEKAGNWADCIRQKKPVIYNDFKLSPNQKGLPTGHTKINRIISFPLIENNQVIAIFGVGNKDEPYNQNDVLQLELVSAELNKNIKQRQSEAEVLESKENYHSLFENMLDGFAYCKMIYNSKGAPSDFEYVEVNSAFEKLTGIKKENAIGKRVTQVIPGIKRANPNLFKIYGRVSSLGQKERFEVFVKPLNLWLSISAYSPRKGYFAAVFEEITESKRAQEALKQSEERLRLSQEIAHLGSWDLNIKQNKLTWSDEAYRIFGLKPQEFAATYEAFLACVHPEDRLAVDTAYSNSLLEGQDGYEIEHRIIRRDTGEVRIVHEKCLHHRDKTGKIYRSIGMTHDITDRKNVENALRLSEERLQLKLDSILSPDVELEEQDLANFLDISSLQAMMNYLFKLTKMGFALIDLQGNVLVGTGWQDLCTKFHRINSETLKNCIESDLQLTSGLKKGEVRLYKCKNNMWDVVTPLFIGGKHMGNLFFGQFFFEGENVNRELFAAQAEKYGFNKQSYLQAFDLIPKFSRESVENLMIFYSKLAEMLSKLSYSNLKLANALANQKILQEKLEEKAREVEEYATQMEELAEERAAQLKDSERMAAIGQTAGMVGHDIRNPLQSILGDIFLAKGEIEALSDSGVKASLSESLDSIEKAIDYVNKIVADLQDFARPIRPNTQEIDLEKIVKELVSKTAIPENIHIECEIAESARTVLADETLIKRVIVNLINNAVQAMPSGGKLFIRTHRENQSIVIFVQDTGNGIPEEVKTKIFTPLFTTKSKGQGFGLAVVKRLTEALNGQVTFQSKTGDGTTFKLRLPAPLEQA